MHFEAQVQTAGREAVGGREEVVRERTSERRKEEGNDSAKDQRRLTKVEPEKTEGEENQFYVHKLKVHGENILEVLDLLFR